MTQVMNIERLCVSYGRVEALHEVSLQLTRARSSP
jgi:ABC-type branched-subunit amino acid transport system ATPase component